MKNIKITQEHIEKYVATTDNFWEEFQQSLSAPYSLWNEFKDRSVKEWINLCRNSEDMIPYINLLIEYPILKGEYLISYSSGTVLTNFRLLIKDESAGVPNIPLNKILEYNDNGEIKYEKNGQTLELQYSEFMDDNLVNSTKSRNETKNLSDEQIFILESSMFELNKHNSKLKIPKIEIPEHQDTSINLKQKIDNLSQEQKNNNLVNTEMFWKEYHSSLKNDYSIWNKHKETTFDEWISMCWNTPEMINHFKILFQYPMLKGEFPIAFAASMVLTNYRLVINDSSNNIPSIPLTKIKKYSLQEGGIIEIENQPEKLRYDEMLSEEIVIGAINMCKKNGLDKLQENLITNSLENFTKDFPNLDIPKIEMYPLTEEQKEAKVKYEKIDKRSGFFAKLVVGGIIVGLIFGAIMLFGNSSPNGQYCSVTQGCEWYVELNKSGSCVIHNPMFGGIHRTGTYKIDGKTVYMIFSDGEGNVTAKLNGSKLIVGSTVYKK